MTVLPPLIRLCVRELQGKTPILCGVRNDNLTFDEAQNRSALLEMDRYDVHVDLTYAADPTMESFPVKATITFSADVTGPESASTFIEYIHHSVDSVTLNEQRLDLTQVVHGSRIELPDLAPTNTLVIHGRSLYSRSGEGLHRFIDPQDHRTYLYTQYEPSDARRVFPTFEQPDLKANFSFTVTAPSDWVVASNTEIVATEDDPVLEGVSRRRFAPTQRMSTYITTLLAGQYHAVSSLYRRSGSDSGATPMTLYCRQSMAESMDSENIFDLVRHGLDFFQDLFDYPYPWGKYDQAFVPEYNLGAMENPGLVTFTESYLFPEGSTVAQREGRADVIMHEMSHMWFGDLVTMRWWSDLWLKESFAEFMGSLAAERVGGYEEAWVTFANRRKAWAYTQDQYSTTHPIVADIPDVEAAKQNFDGITYAKGASVLKQLVAYVGFEQFIQAARVYFKRHQFGTAELSDFLAVLSEACGRDLSEWARAWLQTAGVTHLTYSAQRSELAQTFPDEASQAIGRPHVLNLATFSLDAGSLQRTQVVPCEVSAGAESMSTTVSLDVSPASDAESIVVVNQDDQTYALALLAESDVETALEYGHTISDPLDRGVLGSSLWNMVRLGQVDPRRYLEHVGRGLSRENSPTLLDTLLIHAGTALRSYVPEPERTSQLESLAAHLRDGLASVEEGSDQQRVLVQHSLVLGRESGALADIAYELLDWATTHPGTPWRGLTLGDQIQWLARTALAAHGRLTRTALEESYAANPSQYAAIGHARSLAALPSTDEKALACKRIFGEDLSNDLLSATAVGLMTGDPALRQGQGARYFDGLGAVWADHSIGMATRIVRGLFPTVDDDVDPVAATQEWLADHPDAPRALRRELTERSEDATRASRIRDLWSKI